MNKNGFKISKRNENVKKRKQKKAAMCHTRLYINDLKKKNFNEHILSPQFLGPAQ